MAETEPRWICLNCAKDHARRMDCTTLFVPFVWPGQCDWCGETTAVADVNELGGAK